MRIGPGSHVSIICHGRRERDFGEVGTVEVPVAIANAVYHASGRRIRSLPITLDKLL
jgi:hypothetical protein